MLLEINELNYNKKILPYIRNGICIDTSIMKIFLDGFIDLRFSNKENAEYNELLDLFGYLDVYNKWRKFWITPHLLTEICRHLCQDDKRNKRNDWNEIVKEILPILKEIEEIGDIEKNRILDLIDIKKPVIELGDLSIFIATENMLKSKHKVTILSKDEDIIKKYKNYPNVMMIDYEKSIRDLKVQK